MLLLSISAIGCTGSRSSIVSDADRDLGQRIVHTAQEQIGSKYERSARGPKKFDCSGLVQYVYDQYDFQLRGSAASMSTLGRSIDIAEARSGDLIFYKRKGSVFHVSIISEASSDHLKVVHSTTSRGVIEEDVLSSAYWYDKIYKIISLDSLDR